MGYHDYHFWFMWPHPKPQKDCCAGCDKKDIGCTGVSAADTFNLRHGCVHFRVNGPEFYRCQSGDQWSILPLSAYKILDVMHEIWPVFYLPARQCSCSPITWYSQPSETRHLHSFHQTFCHPTAQIWTPLTAKCGEKSSLFVKRLDSKAQNALKVA